MARERLLKFIASLSDKERDQYKKLIEDALARDKIMEENFRAGLKNAAKFAENMKRMEEEVIELQSGILMINEELREARDRAKIVSNFTGDNGPCMN